MNFSQAFKVFQLNILRQAGVAVTPQQVGLKSDPIADLQARNSTNAFSTLLGNLTSGGTAGLTPPTPPTPPADPADAAAQTKYQQDLLTYQNNFQIYNQRFMQLMMQQMQAMQRSVVAAQRNASSSGNNSGADSVLATGGILETDF